jgi:hypothetical protein
MMPTGSTTLGDRLARRRLGLVLAYLLATTLAQVGHAHAPAAEVRCLSSCDDPRPHLSGHASPDLGRAADECPACQFRSKLYPAIAPGRLNRTNGDSTTGESDAAVAPRRASQRPNVRAPPIV